MILYIAKTVVDKILGKNMALSVNVLILVSQYVINVADLKKKKIL